MKAKGKYPILKEKCDKGRDEKKRSISEGGNGASI